MVLLALAIGNRKRLSVLVSVQLTNIALGLESKQQGIGLIEEHEIEPNETYEPKTKVVTKDSSLLPKKPLTLP